VGWHSGAVALVGKTFELFSSSYCVANSRVMFYSLLLEVFVRGMLFVFRLAMFT